ncbi:MAG TPA: hypothetical protein VFD92_16305 [Candidatus Binatia bacterium]|nr:hypothetical protein [Candidatus Binatia bacterium]
MTVPPSRRLALAASALLAVASACGDSSSGTPRTIGVLGAFPAELAAILDRTNVEETREVEGRIFRIGSIGRTRVVVGMTGVGLVNAQTTTRTLLDNFDVSGVVVSAVAGSPLRDADVTVPETWVLDDGSRYRCHEPWLDVAKQVTAAGAIALERCAIVPDVTPIPGVPPGTMVCFPYEPGVVVGGYGSSSDPFGGQAFQCLPTTDDVFACDTALPGAFVPVSVGPEATAELTVVGSDTQVAYDEETAAIAREVTASGLPFIAFRAASDGGPDPLNLTEFVEFFAYYRLAAHNAAAAAAAFIDRLP